MQPTKLKTESPKQRRKADAMAWARLVYKMYKEDKQNGKILMEQNNAPTSKI